MHAKLSNNGAPAGVCVLSSLNVVIMRSTSARRVEKLEYTYLRFADGADAWAVFNELPEQRDISCADVLLRRPIFLAS